MADKIIQLTNENSDNLFPVTSVNAISELPLGVAYGGTGATDKVTARNNLGISIGTAAPSGGADGDIYIQIL